MSRLLPAAAVLAAVALPVPGAPAAPGPEVTVTMFVDRVVVEPGGTIHYELTVENTGDADAPHVRVTSHIPEHTTAASRHCPEGTVEPDGDVCLQPEVQTPGGGDPAHQIVHSRAPFPAGAAFTLRFAVTVDAGTAPGTHLPNHAHAAVLLGDEQTSAGVDTVVVGTAPRGLFGRDTVSMSGQSVVDGTDPSVARVGSNGDIVLSGGTRVEGDATPGPGHRVVLSGGATVTGSTEPAAEGVVLPDVVAAPHAARNDNGRICAEPGDCADAAYSDAERSLVVRGTARLRPGSYFLCRLDVAGTVAVDDGVTLWMGPGSACGGTTTFRLSSGGAVLTTSGRPGDFQVRIEGFASIEVTGRSALDGAVYAPRSAFTLDGGSRLSGTFTAGSVVATAGGAQVRLDASTSR